MPLLQMLATVQEEQSLGHLQELTSPVLGKLKEALIFTRLANAQRRAFGSRTVVLEGKFGAQLHIGWFEGARLLVMAYKNIYCDELKDSTGVTKNFILSNGGTRCPTWLGAVAPEAQVSERVLEIFESFKDKDHCLAQVMQSVTGGVTPRRITSVGYCVGGSIASVAAVFAALQCPTADVRCITFGSQLVGNAAFAEAFRWLIGLSYRLVYRRDPVPGHRHRRLNLLNNTLVHVHGEIYIDDKQLKPGKRPYQFQGDPNDHSLMRYAEALHAMCRAHFEEDQAAGGNLYAKFACCYLQLSGAQPDQHKKKAQPHQAGGALLSDQASKTGNSVNPMTGQTLPEATGDIQEGPFDFRSAAEDGRPPGYGQPAPNELTAEEMERGQKCGKAILERAMLGPPLDESGSSGQAESISHKACESLDVAATGHVNSQVSSRWFDNPHDPRLSPLMSVVQADIESTADQESAVRPDASGAATATAQADSSSTGHSNASINQTGHESVAMAESISPRYSSQQSQGTNADWDSGSPSEMGTNVHGQVPHGYLGTDSQQQQQQDTVESVHQPNGRQLSSPGDSTSAKAGDGASGLIPARGTPQGGSPVVTGRTSMSRSGQQANALAEDVQGMAPNPGSSMIGEEGGGRPWLKRAFSLVDQENLGVDINGQMTSLEKVLITGKISQAVVVAAAAYRTEAEFSERTGIQQNKLIIDELHTNTHVHVGWLEGGTAILAFRGTQTAQDGLQDVKIVRQSIDHLQKMFPGTQAHSGFLQQFAGVCRPDVPEKNMSSVIEQLSGGRIPTRVLCCGHSLGGALATLGATWAALQYPQADIRCITFGSPRVGNKAFKRAFHTLVGTSLRLVHGGDPVPVLPPAFVYHHVNGAIHIRNGKIKLKSRPWHFKLHPNVADHLVARYNAGIFLHMPGGVEEMPLPRPKTVPRYMRRMSSLDSSDMNKSSKESAVGRSSVERGLENVSPADTDDAVPQVGGSSAYGAYGAVYDTANTLQGNAVQEARGVADALHLTRRPEGLFGSFRKLKRDSSASTGSNSGWTIWHMFGCVAVQKGIKDESSSDDDESVHAVHTRHGTAGAA
ncbi:TPA: hypothetical protein ACH3X3_008171 [Trebouxia sp. C0006]